MLYLRIWFSIELEFYSRKQEAIHDIYENIYIPIFPIIENGFLSHILSTDYGFPLFLSFPPHFSSQMN